MSAGIGLFDDVHGPVVFFYLAVFQHHNVSWLKVELLILPLSTTLHGRKVLFLPTVPEGVGKAT